MFLPVVPDNQVKVIMMENGELDILVLDDPTWAAASADPGHPFHNLLRPIGNAGLWYMQPNISLAPMQDVFVRRALAHGADMQTIISAVMGPLTKKATGILSPTLPCGNPAALGHVYDPDLARQELAESSYGSAENLPVINIDLARPEIINMTAAVKEYWKDNLGAVLDILSVSVVCRDGMALSSDASAEAPFSPMSFSYWTSLPGKTSESWPGATRASLLSWTL